MEYKKNNTGNKGTGILNKINYFLNHNKIGELLVVQGLITPYELKSALKTQKSSHTPLGQVLLEFNYINKYQLNSFLIRQKALRLAAAILLYATSMTGFIRNSRASENNSARSGVVMASLQSNSIDDIYSYPALFGADERQSTNLKAFTKWLDMFDRFDQEMKEASSKRTIQAMKIQLSEYRNFSIKDKAQKVDEMMNSKKYIVDSKNWGKSDYWATPIEFMENGGDCEDFAIAKYVALRTLGVPDSRLRVAIVQDTKKNIPHAVLIVYSEDDVYVLDNQSEVMKSASAVTHYKPIFSINHSAWWLHTAPGASGNTIVASAK